MFKRIATHLASWGAAVLVALPLGCSDNTKELRQQDSINLKQIGLGMHKHHDREGYLPAAIFAESGAPLLSWRVAILPYIGEWELYKEFRLNEPWDSEHNKTLIGRMPRLYLLPGLGKPEDGLSHYRILASIPSVAPSESALFNWPDPADPKPVERIRFEDIKDGTSTTIMVVATEEAVIWTKPDAILYAPGQPLPKLYRWGEHVQMLWADGGVYGINPDERNLRAGITREAGTQPNR
jgi:hypothetical protein